MCDDDPFSIAHCPDKHITRKTGDEAVDYSLTVLKVIPDCFVTSKMIKKFFTALYADKNIYYFNEGSGQAVYDCKGMSILDIDLNIISLDDKFDEDDPDTIILIRLFACHIKFKKCKELKKELTEELMPAAWHPDRWWD